MMRSEEIEDISTPSIPSPEFIHSSVGGLGPDSSIDAPTVLTNNPARLPQLCEGRVTRYAPPSSSFSPFPSTTCTVDEQLGHTQGQGQGQGQSLTEEGLYETVWSDGATLYLGELAYQNARVFFDKIAADKMVLVGEIDRVQAVKEEKEKGREEEEKQETQASIEVDTHRKRKFDDVIEVKSVEVDQAVVCKVEEGGAGNNNLVHEVVEERNDGSNEVVNEVNEGGAEKKAKMYSEIEPVIEVGIGSDIIIGMPDIDIDVDAHLQIVADSMNLIHDVEDDEIDSEEGGEGEEEEDEDVDVQDSTGVGLPSLGSYAHPNPHLITGGTPLLMRSKYSVPYETVLKWRWEILSANAFLFNFKLNLQLLSPLRCFSSLSRPLHSHTLSYLLACLSFLLINSTSTTLISSLLHLFLPILCPRACSHSFS